MKLKSSGAKLWCTKDVDSAGLSNKGLRYPDDYKMDLKGKYLFQIDCAR